MNIREYIQRKKEEHFLYRDSDKLQLQKASLEKERKELQARRALESSVRAEQKQISELRSAPRKERMAGISRGFQGLKKAADNANKGISKFSSQKSTSPFSAGGNPFGPDPKVEKKAAERPRQIVINIHGSEEKKKEN